MSKRILFGAIVASAVAVALPGGTVQAADKYAATIVESFVNPTTFGFAASGSKVQIKPSTKAGDGGIIAQLNLKFVDCPPNNDGGAPGKCGVKDSPIVDHVLNLSVNSLGVDFPSIAGIKYSIEKGKGAFQATGKNKINGTAFGAFVSLVFNTPLGIGLIKLHEAGSVPADCDTVPLAMGNGCVDGGVYGIAGIVVGSDSGVTFAGNGDCGLTGICVGMVCAPEPCTLDADCNDGGGVGGSGQCGSNGNCCDPNVDPTCTGQVP
jgi:hypothetical protein